MSELSSTIFRDLYRAALRHTDWRSIGLFEGNAVHVAVMREPFLSLLLDGVKTIESRFSRNRISPFHQVAPGDIVVMKAGPICGAFQVGWVKYFDLHETDVATIAKVYGPEIGGDDTFWQQQADKRYATLIQVTRVRRLTPIRISKADRRGWLSLGVPPQHS